MITIQIVANDVETVAKAVIIDSKNRVLFLKRSKYTKKFASEWDLPGGHLKNNESLEKGLKREVKEETGIDIENPIFLTKLGHLHFFKCNYISQNISLSHEHISYTFMEEENLRQSNDNFQKIALGALIEEE